MSNNQPRPTTPQPEITEMSPENGIEALKTPAPTREKGREKPVPTVVPRPHVRSSQNNKARSSRPPAEEKNSSQKSQSQDAVEEVSEVEDEDLHLDKFDWDNIEHRYREALIQANQVEDELVERFDSLADAFQIWAEVSGHRDNERAQKRLKTRMLHVQLSEKDLENKKHQYTNVVEAFKNALDLLRKSTTMPMR